jgi:NAD-dependent aldehyde dehydrogenases
MCRLISTTNSFPDSLISPGNMCWAIRSIRPQRSAPWHRSGWPIPCATISGRLGKGARALIDTKAFAKDSAGSTYVAPQVLVDVDHGMKVMMEETFGPVVGIMKVKSDDEAIRLMNDSPYGLTASVWTRDMDAAEKIGAQVETGTVFMNRCDYLDPGLAWTGVKETGRGATLSKIGYEMLTRPKSFHLRAV